jgi:hypothetical protein
MESPRIYVDLLKTDAKGRIWLTTVGTQEDLGRHGINLEEGMILHLYTDDLNAEGQRDDLVMDGVARFDARAQAWVAEIDREAIRHISEVRD